MWVLADCHLAVLHSIDTQMDHTGVTHLCQSLIPRVVPAEVFRLGMFALSVFEILRSVAEEATAGEGSTVAPSMSPPLRPSKTEAVEADKVFHLFQSDTGPRYALLLDAERRFEVVSIVPWPGVFCLEFGEAPDLGMAESRYVDPM